MEVFATLIAVVATNFYTFRTCTLDLLSFIAVLFKVAKVSKLLLELERGNIHRCSGKSLDEIEFDLEGNSRVFCIWL